MLCYRRSPNSDWINLEDHVFDDGAEAGQHAKDRNASSRHWGDSTRYRVVPVPLEDPLAWKIRENTKLKDGTHAKCPWYDDYKAPMYEHIHPDDPTKVRFFATEQDAHRNRYTTMAPGKFFTRYIDGHPGKDVVETYCAKMGLDMTVSKLHIVTTPDEIERVYVNGPHSCMAYKYEEDGEHLHLAPFHPVRLYGDTGLGVAYIERGGEITGRCMVWPEKKKHGRIYGDTPRMRERLAEEGYEEDWNFHGIKMNYIEHNGNIVAPYVDGDLDAIISDDGKHLILTDEPTIILKGPDGVASDTSCGECGDTGVVLRWSEYFDTYICPNHSREDD